MNLAAIGCRNRLLTKFCMAMAGLLIGAAAWGAEAGVRSAAGTPDDRTQAHATKIVYPGYPGLAKRRNLEGWVEISFNIRPDGRAADPIIVNSSGICLFETAALATIPKHRFEPALASGRRVVGIGCGRGHHHAHDATRRKVSGRVLRQPDISAGAGRSLLREIRTLRNLSRHHASMPPLTDRLRRKAA